MLPVGQVGFGAERMRSQSRSLPIRNAIEGEAARASYMGKYMIVLCITFEMEATPWA